MQQHDIFKVLDFILDNNERGTNLVPNFVGDSGIGKTSIINQWAKSKGDDFKMLLFPLGCMEANEFIGVMSTDKGRSKFNLPNFWPTEGRGVILLNEINRAKEDIHAPLLQLLQERSLGFTYTLPNGWIILADSNPDNENYSTRSFDLALENRTIKYKVDFEIQNFIDYAKKNKFNGDIIRYLSDGEWLYRSPSEVKEMGKYISPRNWEQLNPYLCFDIDDKLKKETILSILGETEGIKFIKFIEKSKNISFKDFEKDFDGTLKLVESFFTSSKYESDLLSKVVDIVTNNIKFFNNERICKLLKAMPEDQCLHMLIKIATVEGEERVKTLVKEYPEIKKIGRVG